MSLKLNRKGTVSYINNHPALMGRDLTDQHPMTAITGLIAALDEKYIKPQSGIPKDHMGFDVATLDDIITIRNYLVAQIDNANKDITINADNISAIQDFLDSKFGDGNNGMPNVPELGFAYREGFRDEFIGTIGDDIFTLSNKYLLGGQTLKVFRDGELLLVGEDYHEISDTEIKLDKPLTDTVFITCICDSMSTVLSPVHEEIISLDAQTTFKLKNTYNVGSHSLSIFVKGLRLEKDLDYTEVDMETIELATAYPAGTKLIFRQEMRTLQGEVMYENAAYNQKTWMHKETATAGQTIITLPEVYIPGANMLMVSCDGLVQGLGTMLDYLEIDDHTIEFNYELDDGAEVTVTCIAALYNWSETYIALRNQTKFQLTHPYFVGRNDILVYENGILLQNGKDYVETNNRTITFTEAPHEGSPVIIFKRR